MTNNHPNRARRRYGHLPGHIRDAFLEAVEAFEDWNPSGALSPARVGYEIRHRPRQISVAEACGLVWGCTDILPGMVYRTLTEDLDIDLKRQTYAAAAHAILHYLKGHAAGVDPAADARLKRMYDKRDEMWRSPRNHDWRQRFREATGGARSSGAPASPRGRLRRTRVLGRAFGRRTTAGAKRRYRAARQGDIRVRRAYRGHRGHGTVRGGR